LILQLSTPYTDPIQTQYDYHFNHRRWFHLANKLKTHITSKLPKFPRLEQPSSACCTAIPDNAIQSASWQKEVIMFLISFLTSVCHMGPAVEKDAICSDLITIRVGWLGVGLEIKTSRVRLPASAVPGSNSGQVVNTHVPVSPSSTIWYRPKGQKDALRPGR